MTHSEKLINLYAEKQRLFFYVKIIPLLRIGCSMQKIIELLNKDDGTIRKYLKRFGSEYDKQNALNNKRIAYKNSLKTVSKIKKYTHLYPKIKKCLNKGMSSFDIAKLFNFDPSTAQKVLLFFNDKNNLEKLTQNGKKRKAKSKPKTDATKLLCVERKLIKKKKYFFLIEKCVRMGYHTQQISDFFKKRNIVLSYAAIQNRIKYYGTKFLAKRAKLNGYISRNKGVFTDGVVICKRKTSKDEIRFRNIIALLVPKINWQYEIKAKNSTYTIDIAIVDHKLAVEYDGFYWHSKNTKRDKQRDNELAALGWKTIRFVFKHRPSDKRLTETFLETIKKLELNYILK